MSNITNNYMKHHMNNLGRLVGHDVSNRYSYIVSQNDLVNAYVQMKDELGYPLMMDSKYRRAIVYNKKGLEKQIRQSINDTIINNIHLLERMVVEDIVAMLNGIVQSANGTIVLGKGGVSKSATNLFVDAMVKGVVKGVGSIIEDMTNPKDDRR